jgi:hypothetical protein
VAVEQDTFGSAEGHSVASVDVNLTIASNRDRYLLVFIIAGDPVAPIDLSSVNWNTSEALTELLDFSTASFNRLWIYGLKNPTATTANVTAAFASAGNDDVAVIAVSLYNVDQTTPVGTARSSTTAVNTDSVYISTDGGLPGGRCYGMGFRQITSVAANTIADVDGIPEWIASGALSTATAQTSRTPAAPAGAVRGDLEIAHCSSENNATHSCASSGWVKIGQTNSGASYTVSHWYRIHTGTNVDPVITWTGSADATARRYLFRDTKADTTGTAPVAYHGTVGTGTVSPHTSTGANTTEDDVLAAYIDICNANTAMVAETSWTERVDSGSATGPVRSYLATRDMTTAGSATGNISETGGAAAYVQQQFEIYNARNGDQINVAERESISNVSSLTVSYEPADVYNCLGWTGAGGTTQFVAAGAVVVNASKSLIFDPSPMRAHLAR